MVTHAPPVIPKWGFPLPYPTLALHLGHKHTYTDLSKTCALCFKRGGKTKEKVNGCFWRDHYVDDGTDDGVFGLTVSPWLNLEQYAKRNNIQKTSQQLQFPYFNLPGHTSVGYPPKTIPKPLCYYTV